MAAEHVTPEKIAFFLHHTSGFICAPITSDRRSRARAPTDGRAQHREHAHRVPGQRRRPPRHDHRHLGLRPGRHRAGARRSRRPGPATSPVPATSSRSRLGAGGVLKRAGHTEATIDLARMAGLYPAGILCEIVDDKKMGMARQPELLRFADKHGLLHDLHRRPDPLPAPEREARAPGGRGSDPDRVGRLHRLRVRVGARRRAARCLRARATSRARTTCSCGCTASASPATCSGRCAATAACSSTRP